MANERTIICGELATGSHRSGRSDALALRMTGPKAPVHLRIEDISRSLTQDIPEQWFDLVEIATYVYIADQAVSRGGDGVEDAGANWRRRLLFEIPVRCPDLWRSDRVLESLRDTLSFLSEDEYEFRFHPLKKPTVFERYLAFSDSADNVAPQEVILFSGGMDSLGGVVQESITKKQRALIVRHRPTSKLETRQNILREMLDEHAGDKAPVHITVDINKAKHLNHEYTQRSRSFLYASLAATIARMCGLSAIRFFENGIVSLNLPISRQVVGARATRTTHPRVLNGFRDLFSLVAEKPFAVTNGFQWMTKTDVARLIADAGCGSLIEYSQSCTHTWEWTTAHPHCGTCSQCIDRRFAVLAAGLDTLDPASRYAVDLLAGQRDDVTSRVMLASYVETALRVAQMTELDFFSHFGEVARIVRHLDGSPDDNARRIHKLYKRHGEDVGKVIDDGIAKYRTEIRKQALPASCLLRLVHDPSIPSDGTIIAQPALQKKAVEVKPSKNMFQRKGQAWVYRFNGRDELVLLPSRGAAYLHRLLSSSGKPFSAADMVLEIAKAPHRYPMGDAGEVIDKEARDAYRAEYEDLQDRLDRAKAAGNDAEIDDVMEKMKHLAKQLKNVRPGGKIKRDKSVRNRVRNSVSNAIVRAIDSIVPDDAECAEHLRTYVKRGFHPVYSPPDGVTWET